LLLHLLLQRLIVLLMLGEALLEAGVLGLPELLLTLLALKLLLTHGPEPLLPLLLLLPQLLRRVLLEHLLRLGVVDILLYRFVGLQDPLLLAL
jgi:hypothetical protein